MASISVADGKIFEEAPRTITGLHQRYPDHELQLREHIAMDRCESYPSDVVRRCLCQLEYLREKVRMLEFQVQELLDRVREAEDDASAADSRVRYWQEQFEGKEEVAR